MNGRYFPNSKNCVEMNERRTEYLIYGNMIRKPEAGAPIYTPGTVTEDSGTELLMGIRFAWIRARSTVVGAGSSGYTRNDWTGSWDEPELSTFRFWN